jgi:NAD-dependent deacetylase
MSRWLKLGQYLANRGQHMPKHQRDYAAFKRIVILTGAGLSAESGIATFRDAGGIWSKVRVEDVATPEGFARDPATVHAFYNARRQASAGVHPNQAHDALARLEAGCGDDLLVVTQNIDHLHEAAGSTRLLHMHGELAKSLCNQCQHRAADAGDLSVASRCGACRKAGGMRPDVVWFGEMPYHMERIEQALAAADLFISIGTSGNVYPAAGFVAGARRHGAYTVELNLEPSAGAALFDDAIHGPATQVVPAFVERLLAARR